MDYETLTGYSSLFRENPRRLHRFRVCSYRL
jgi:hypothetical protein